MNTTVTPDRIVPATEPAGKTGRSGAIRWGLVLLALLYGLACLFSTLDRASARNASIERIVPFPFRGEADLAAARLAVSRKDADAGIAAAINAMRSQPIVAGGPSMLGSALLLKNLPERADQAFRVAAAAGWRDTMTQIYWAEQSIGSGDWDLAAARIDAILRARPRLPQADLFRKPFETDPQGRAALARILAERPPWLHAYVTNEGGTDRETLLRRVPVLLAVADEAGPLGCGRLRAMVNNLMAMDTPDAADRLWRAHCPGAEGLGRLTDGSFAQTTGDDPFGWQLHPGGDISLEVAGQGSDAALVATNRGGVARLAISQPVRLSGRTAAVRWRATEADGTSSKRIAVSLDCGPPRRPIFEGGAEQVVAIGDCDIQQLRVWVDKGPGSVRIDEIALGGV